MTAHRPSREARLAALGAHRALATATVVALGLAALTAACADPPATGPRAVASPEEVDAAVAQAGGTGPAVAVWTWNRDFVEGDPGAEPLAHALTWVAPTGPAAAPTGTVTVWQDPAGDGTVELAARDDDADLANALLGLAPDGTLVTDRSDWLVVTGDRVRSLLPPSRTELTGEVTVAAYRAVLADRVRAAVPDGSPGSDTVGG